MEKKFKEVKMEGRLRKGEGKKVDKVVREERREVLDT